MKFGRLSFLIPLLLILSSLMGSALLFWQQISVANSSIRQAGVSNLHTTLTQLQAMLNTQLAADRLEDARISLSVFALSPGIRTLLLADEKNSVILANRYIWEGSSAPQVSAYDNLVAQGVREYLASSASVEGSLLKGYYPLTLKFASGGLDPDRIGVLFVEYDLAPQLAQARHNAVVQASLVGGLMMAVAIAVALILHWLVTLRVKKIVETSTRFAAGDLDARVKLSGRDELAELGLAFDRMAEQRKAAQDEVIQVNLRNRLILDATGEGIYGLGLDGRCTFANPAAAQLLGLEVDELLGQHSHDQFHHSRPDGRPYREQDCPIQAVCRRGVAYRGNDFYWHKDGSCFPVELVCTPIVEAGQVTGAVVVFRDITENKHAQHQLQLLSFALDRVKETMLLMGENDPHFIYVNQSAASTLGYSRDQLTNGMSVFDIDPDWTPDIWSTFWTELLAHRQVQFETKHRTKDGRIFPVEVTSNYFEFDGKIYNLAICRDIVDRKQAEDALRLLSERLQLATRAANIGIWDWDIVNNELVWDDSMYQLYGIQRADFSGAYDAWINTVHPEDRARTDGEIQAALRGERQYAPEFRIVRPDGSIRFIKADSRTIQDSEGKPLRMIGTNTDITERKRILEAMERSQSALEEAQRIAHIGSWDVDMVNDVLTWSDEIFRIWEIDKRQFEATFAAFLETVHPEDRDKVTQAYNQAIVDKSVYQVEHRLLFPDGRVKYIHERGEPYFDDDGRPVRFIGTSLDITERKLAEEELVRYKEHLEETVEQRTAELQLARDAAEAANKAKSVFLANMSHELRTPMNAILGFSNMMRRDPLLTENQRENLDIINRSGEHLLRLINDVLEVAKIEAGRLQLEIGPFDLGGMVREIADMMQIRARQKGLQLLLDQSSEFPRYIKSDEARMRQIIINLINNAVKFTDQGGVTVRLGVMNDGRQQLLIEVEDTGPGIIPEDQQHLFEPFVQLGESDSQDGTGLGLTITRQFVKMMGGNISVESTLGKGAVFRVELPYTAASEAEILTPASRRFGEVAGVAPGTPCYRILIVEDQQENQVLLSRLMTDLGFEVKVVDNGRQCLELFQRWQPDLIWMDRRMPVMDGIEATKRLRQLPNGQKVKIVAVTASAFKEQQQEILDAGMDDFVRKPYRFNEIYDCLARQLHVEYQYVNDESIENYAELAVDAAALSALPAIKRHELREALLSLDCERIAQIIDQIGVVDANLGKALSKCTDIFDYPTILNALKDSL